MGLDIPTHIWASNSNKYHQIPPRLSTADTSRNYPDNNDRGFIRDHQDYMNKYSSATTQSTSRFANSAGFNNGGLPVTPAKSVCANSHYQYSCYPSYMENTQSFKAKVRSSSAPKQRPGTAVPSPRKKLSSLISNDMVESKISLSSNVKMRKSCSQVQDVLNFKNTVMGNIGLAAAAGSSEEEISVKEDGHHGGGDYLPRRW